MKTLYALYLSLFLSVTGLSQLPAYQGGPEPSTFQPPKVVSEKFKREYPEVTPTWHVEEKYYVADFTDTISFKGISLVYDKNGKIVRRESEMENSTYPAKINDYFVKNYPGEKFKTYKCLDDKGIQSYCIKRPTGALWFDKEGNYIPEKKKRTKRSSR